MAERRCGQGHGIASLGLGSLVPHHPQHVGDREFTRCTGFLQCGADRMIVFAARMAGRLLPWFKFVVVIASIPTSKCC
jgi:hypothetical protein